MKLLAVALADEALRPYLLRLPPRAFRHAGVQRMVQRIQEGQAPEEALAEAEASFRAEFARLQMRLAHADPGLLRQWALEKFKKKELLAQISDGVGEEHLETVERLKHELLRLSEQRLKGRF